jgi:hypothetical protein
MPFKRKIKIREAPKRSSRKVRGGKRKIPPDGPVKERKSRAPRV